MADQSNNTSYKNKFRAQKYELITLTVKKGQKDTIKQHAASRGMSLNGYIVDLIAKDMSEPESI